MPDAPVRRFRISLRSLILFVAIIAVATGLWYRWSRRDQPPAARELQSNDGLVRSKAASVLANRIRQGSISEASLLSLEATLIKTLPALLESNVLEDQEKAAHQLRALGYVTTRLKSTRSLSLLIKYWDFENPNEKGRYTRGPMTYGKPEPKDLPVFIILCSMREPAVEPVFQRVLKDKRALMHHVCAELLISNYKFKGALEWLARARKRNGLTPTQLNRIKAIQGFVEMRR